MGQKHGHLRPDQLADLANGTEFTEEEINEWYKDFKKDCPSGYLGLKDFQKIYSYIFPGGDPTAFAEQVFRAFDEDKNGVIDFREFLCALSVTSRGTMEQKLAWSFRMYDADEDGCISKDELLSTITAIHKMIGPMYGDSGLEISRAMNPVELTESIFNRLDKNEDGKLSKEEFIAGAKSDATVSRILRCDVSHGRPKS